MHKKDTDYQFYRMKSKIKLLLYYFTPPKEGFPIFLKANLVMIKTLSAYSLIKPYSKRLDSLADNFKDAKRKYVTVAVFDLPFQAVFAEAEIFCVPPSQCIQTLST